MTSANPMLPYGRQIIEDDDIDAVTRVLRGNYLTTGPATEAFEKAFAEKTGAKYALSCSSGTAALHLAALALGLGPEDQVIVPSITFLATANAARYVGAEVIFSDVDPDTGLMRGRDFEDALRRGSNVKAVFPVHLAGQPTDMADIAELGRTHNVRIVEDACHALGTRWMNGNEIVTAGDARFSDMAAFSFHPVKTIAMGEGGAITTNNSDLARRIGDLRSHGMVRRAEDFQNDELAYQTDGSANPWYYEMPEPGFNYRSSDIHCALGLSQLGKLDRFVDARRNLVAAYDTRLQSLYPTVCPLGRVAGAMPGWHLYVVLIDFVARDLGRAEVMRRLAANGIGTQVHYIPVHTQPYYRRRYETPVLPGAAAYYERCLSLPLHPNMDNSDVERVCDALRQALNLA